MRYVEDPKGEHIIFLESVITKREKYISIFLEQIEYTLKDLGCTLTQTASIEHPYGKIIVTKTVINNIIIFFFILFVSNHNYIIYIYKIIVRKIIYLYSFFYIF